MKRPAKSKRITRVSGGARAAKSPHKARVKTTARLPQSGNAFARVHDPHFERERRKYAEPIASREMILSVLTAHGTPLDFDDLARKLAINEEEKNALERRLAAMHREGQIMRNRRDAICVVDKLDLVAGAVTAHPDGYGFLVRDDGGDDLYLGPHEMHKVMHGDRVAVRVSGIDRRGRGEGKIVEVLSRAQHRVVGRLHEERGVLFVVAENRRIHHELLVPPGQSGAAKPGQVVVAELVEQPGPHTKPIARVAEVLGNYADPGMEIEIALRKHDMPHQFPATVQKASAAIRKDIGAAQLKGREDLRALPLVTIDGETARDFDDAVYCEPQGKQRMRLVVAIADVSHYVKHGDALDREAMARGNSVYFPRRVIPMLPEVLSNGLCSLNPEVDRLCMACDMLIDTRGHVVDYRFYPAVMWSHARLTYTEVARALANPDSTEAGPLRRLTPHLINLHQLYKQLLKARNKRGAIDFESTETRMEFDAAGKISRIVPVERNDAHRLIEECMLAANVCASDYLSSNKHPTLYRVHEGPTPEKLLALREFLKGFGLQLEGGDAPGAGDYARLLVRCKERPDARLLQTVMLRSLRQAVYSPDNAGHFGLAYDAYAHFTSPIRRYPDLLVHRAIKAVLRGQRYEPGNWPQLGEHCSNTERRADEATRDVEAWLKCYYMRDRVGETYSGTVSGVTSFGIFVTLDDLYVEGLVHISDLGSDYFHFDAARHTLTGERTAARFRLSDRVRVTVVRVDIASSKIDFVLEGDRARRASSRR